MSSPVFMAELVCNHISGLDGDFAHHAIPVGVDALPDALAHYAERHQRAATQAPYFVLPLGLIAWYAMGNDPKEWHGH